MLRLVVSAMLGTVMRISLVAKLQLQVNELNATLKDITPTLGPTKHSTLLPISYRLTHETMPKGFRMPKFRTFDGMRDPGNHLKAYDSQLSFCASEDDVYAQAFLSSLSGAALTWLHKLPTNSIDCWQVKYIKLEEAKKVAEEYNEKLPKKETPRSPKRKPVWDRLQRNPQKKQMGISPRRENGRIRAPQEPVYTSYTPLCPTIGKVYAQMEDMKMLPKPQKLRAPPNRRDQK
ncbi:hypothetical protein LIER_00703 [Lithospermum erythrorhizon]|uniref:Retrotransposon gag domain-containing protein n=1 Tax=Lithospermum erythrorhizon TaxID=34254 RepID=A0AAV3NIV6_LITER